ncbi:hypothetical protein JOL79_17210 [Microbispora sp. RL4-1S]|uniref:Terpene synthase n=1 Tax=Microbispora oryzae TaxID=2806554 RepID=A0A941AKR5_9ACTN|nr:terpene synthase family protein [Microbispora oryzae]MBP2705553.1 hypothetical protein [Microbispora oryzae]
MSDRYETMPGAELGAACALAVRLQRAMRAYAAGRPALFSAAQFDAGFFAALSMVSAFGSPWASPDELTAVTRASMWIGALDHQVDVVAESRAEVDDLVAECLAVARGEAPGGGSPLAGMLADIRDGLTGSLSAAPHPIWADQVGRVLSAMAAEWRWKSEKARIELGEYLDNADSVGSSFVNVSHWIATGDDWTRLHLEELREVSGVVQRYLRLLNDLATHGRERESGDVNALALGAGRDEVTARMAGLAAECGPLLETVAAGSPRVALYLERQIGFNTGFYGVTDYWGAK